MQNYNGIIDFHTVLRFILLTTCLLIVSFSHTMAQEKANYDESKVPDYNLPELLEMANGDAIKTINEWRYLRKPEIIKLFTDHVYGEIPQDFDAITYEIESIDDHALNGMATAKKVVIGITQGGKSLPIQLNLFIPNHVKEPVPVTLLINHRDPEFVDFTREIKRDYWPAEMILERGYAAAVLNVGDVADDDPNSFSEDLIQTFYPEQLEKDNGMRVLSAWAWGAMRVMDYFETDAMLDENRSILVGHSRSGKAALWTGANDERWAITVANESGAGGAALSKRRFGETVEIINNGFPYWFTPNFEKYNNNEKALPLDQHMLVGSIAPRGVYVTAAEDDKWADPKGMYLSVYHASAVYERIYGITTLLEKHMPNINNPTDNNYVGFHIRNGEHNLTRYDWMQFLNFADRHFHITGRK